MHKPKTQRQEAAGRERKNNANSPYPRPERRGNRYHPRRAELCAGSAALRPLGPRTDSGGANFFG
eukprot:13704825-Alexandrium_andersonii.AAC.1